MTNIRRIGVAAAMVLGILVLVGHVPANAAGKNCSDFPNQAAAQAYLRADPSDPDGLDGPPGTATSGQPGVACESLPCPCDTTNVYAQAVSTTTTPALTTVTTSAVTVQRSTATANTGPNDWLWPLAFGGVVAIGAGVRMRGRRAAGTHWV